MEPIGEDTFNGLYDVEWVSGAGGISGYTDDLSCPGVAYTGPRRASEDGTVARTKIARWPATMNREELLDVLRRSGALLEGHFRLSSGLHSAGFVQLALVLQHPARAEQLGRSITERFADLTPTAVLSPALGGVVIGHEVGRALGVRAVFAERQDGVLTLRRGFALAASERVLIVEDVITTGRSTRETMRVATEAGGRVVGVGAIVDRSAGSLIFDVPFHALLEISLPTYPADACPLCSEGIPVVKPGSRPTMVP